ncbi:MAG: TetR/AcrR family transcriptional regulator [Sulfurovum sp.]|nr:TetR/AcrR family transcriptional regulator [Sulfurovum sp.]
MKKMEKVLISITFDFLYRKGYCATSIRDILKIANITKGSMYYHFSSKHDLVLSSMKYYLEQALKRYWVKPLERSEEPIETLIQQIKLYQNMFLDPKNFLDLKHGCPLSNFILDMSDKDPLFFEYLKGVYVRWEKAIEQALDKAKELQQTKTDFNSKHQAVFIMSSLEGIIGCTKAFNDIKILKKGISVLKEHIGQL